MPNIQYAVCGTQQRAPAAQKLSDIVCGPAIIDHHNQPTLNHAHTWQTAYETSQAEWIVVFEDDVVLAPDSLAAINRILDAAPYPLVPLYLGRGVPTGVQGKIGRAIDANPSWVTYNRLLSHVAVAARRDQVPRIVDVLLSSHAPCDTLLGARIRGPWAYPYPSPVDHADGETTVHHAVQGVTALERRAWRFDTGWTPDRGTVALGSV